MSEDFYGYDDDMEEVDYSSTSDDGDASDNDDDKHHNASDDPDSDNDADDTEDEGVMESHSDGSQIHFGGNGFDCTCSGGCLCKYYEKKSTYNTDCVYCGHPLSYHRKR